MEIFAFAIPSLSSLLKEVTDAGTPLTVLFFCPLKMTNSVPGDVITLNVHHDWILVEAPSPLELAVNADLQHVGESIDARVLHYHLRTL